MTESAFDPEALWNKSKVYIDKATQARDDGDDSSFHLWGAIALELLGKAALANIHPALVADPSDLGSLLAACDVRVGKHVRSITAKTVFERLRAVFIEFDTAAADQCMKMMNRRNAELHSGQTPIIGLDARAWVPVLWRHAATLVSAQGKTLEEWLGEDESGRVRAILQDTAETLRQGVLARIGRRRQEFDERCPEGSVQRTDAERRAAARPAPPEEEGGEYKQVECPSCELPAWLFGEEWSSEVMDTVVEVDEDGLGGYYEVLSITYGGERFECPECGLVLAGHDEVLIGQLPETFQSEKTEEPDYEPEFGND